MTMKLQNSFIFQKSRIFLSKIQVSTRLFFPISLSSSSFSPSLFVNVSQVFVTHKICEHLFLFKYFSLYVHFERAQSALHWLSFLALFCFSLFHSSETSTPHLLFLFPLENCVLSRELSVSS